MRVKIELILSRTPSLAAFILAIAILLGIPGHELSADDFDSAKVLFQILPVPQRTQATVFSAPASDSESRIEAPVALHPQFYEVGVIEEGDVWELPLLDGKIYAVRFDRVTQNAVGTRTLRARVEGYSMGYVLISITEDEALLTIQIPEEGILYKMWRRVDDGVYYLMEPESNELNVEMDYGPMIPPPPTEEELQDENIMMPASINDPMELVTIDVMMVYTPSARQWAEGRGGVANLLNQAMEMANLALENSDVFITKRLVHIAEVNYTESGDSSIDLKRLTTSPTFQPFGSTYDDYAMLGFMDEVHDWRDQYGADLVALVSNVTDVGGVAWALSDPNGRPQYGFSITGIRQVSGLTHAHEMGHNMGLHHHKQQNDYPGPGLHSYSAGWRWVGNSGERYASVMTYTDGSYFADGLDHTRVPYFSNPNINYDGVPTGHSVDGDNARTLRETKHVVASYRSETVTEAPVIALTGDLGFGHVAVGQTSTGNYAILNKGNSPLTVSSISYPIGFSGNWSGGTIAAGSSRSIKVTFAPAAVQSYGGTVTVDTNSTSGNNTFAVIGTGVEPTRLIVLSGNMSFGNVAIGQTATRTLTIQNIGNSPLTISGISYPIGFSGNSSSHTISPGSSSSLTVTFAPTAEQSYSGTLSVDSDHTSGINICSVSGTGVDPIRVITLSGDLDFLNVAVGQTATRTLTIQNTGNSPLTVNSISYPAGFSGNWNGGTITVGDWRYVTVTFAPTAAQSYSGTVTVKSNHTSGTNTYSVSGIGVAPIREITLTGDLGFVNVTVGQTATRTLTIHNMGNSLLTVSSISYPIGFSGNWNSGTIAAGSSRSVTVTFAPTAAHGYGGMVTVDSNHTSGTNTHSVSGTGVDPMRVIVLSGDLGFGHVGVSQSATRTFKIQNTGNSPLTVSSINYPIGFSGNWSGGTIAAGSSRSVTVTFAPTAAQNYSGAVTVVSDHTSGTNTYSVSGTGVDPTRVIALAGDLGFGNVVVGQTATRNFTIHNTGNSPLTFNSITWPNGFRSGWSSGTIEAGGSLTVTVTFAPTVAQNYSGTVTVNSNRTSGTNTSAVSGTGVESTRAFELSGDLDFGNVAVGQTASRTLTILNTGNSPLTINSISYPIGFSDSWSDGTIAVGGRRYVSVTFAPTAAQNYSGALTVDIDHTSGNNTYNVIGVGVDPVRVITLSGDLGFVNVAVGQTATRTLTIQNTGNSPLTVSSISFPRGFYGSAGNQPINAGSSRNVTVTFAPTAAQDYSGTVTVNSNHTSGTNTTVVIGTGLAPERVIALSGNLSFGHVAVGQTATRTFTIHNTGNSPLTINSISYPIGFYGNWNGGTIAGGNVRTVTVTFAPTDAQSYTGTVTVDSNHTSGTNTHSVSGTGVAPARVIALSGDLSFGYVPVGQTATRTFTIQNTGNSPLTVSNISFPIGFIGDWSSGTIAAGGIRGVTVTFVPAAAQSYSGTVTVSSNHTSGTTTLAVFGTGVESTRVIALSGDLAFGNVVVGRTLTRTLTIHNTGNSPLTVSSMHFPLGFSGWWNNGTIEVGESRSMMVVFTPTAAQSYSGTVTVNSDSTSGITTFAVIGTGVDATRVIALSGDLSFGNVAIGQTGTRILTIRNIGNSPLRVNSINYPIGFSSNWSEETISAGNSRNVWVTFAPTAAQNYGGTVTVDSDSTSQTTTLAVGGTGVDPTRVIALSGDLGFVNVAVGQTATRTFTIQNTGNSPLTVNSINYPLGFSGYWSSGTIAAGDSRSVTVIFSPTAVESYSGMVTVDSDCTSGTSTLTVSGAGVEPVRVIALSDDLVFSHVAIGQTVTRTFTIQNTGNSPLMISSISYPTGFIGNWSSGTIAAGDSRSITVTFAPAAIQSYGGPVTVESNRTSGTNTFAVSGIGVDSARVIALHGDLGYGNVEVGQTATRTFTIQNTGTSTLTVSSIIYPVDFSGNWISGSIAVGGSRTVTVTFAPTVAESYSGMLTVNSDSTSGIHTLAVSGTGQIAVPLGVALGQPSWTFSTGGSAGWFGQSVVTRGGGSAAQNRSIANSQQSWMETVVDGSGTFSFWWKVSSEACCDYLEFSINGARQDLIAGEVDWHQKSYILSTGTNTLRWRYVKDGSVAIGQDAGWVEGVTWVPSQQGPDFKTYAQWVSQLGLVGDASAPTYRHGPVNLSNLEAFAMGLDPRSASLEDLPQVVPNLCTENELVVSYRVDPSAVGVSYWFEGSVDLTEWFVQQPLDETLTDSDGSIELREATFSTGLEDDLFIRMLYRLE